MATLAIAGVAIAGVIIPFFPFLPFPCWLFLLPLLLEAGLAFLPLGFLGFFVPPGLRLPLLLRLLGAGDALDVRPLCKNMHLSPCLQLPAWKFLHAGIWAKSQSLPLLHIPFT